ncbi:MAG: hypothetical protein ACREOF_10925 [Gemmatimonadales bacterium]
MTKRIWLAAFLALAAGCAGEKKMDDAPATSETMTPADTAMPMPADTMARDTTPSM